MEIPNLYIWSTPVAVGEDGLTHQPVEHPSARFLSLRSFAR